MREHGSEPAHQSERVDHEVIHRGNRFLPECSTDKHLRLRDFLRLIRTPTQSEEVDSLSRVEILRVSSQYEGSTT